MTEAQQREVMSLKSCFCSVVAFSQNAFFSSRGLSSTYCQSASMVSVEAVIRSIWRRTEQHEADRSDPDRQRYFARDRCKERVQIGGMGLHGNMTYHTLPRAAQKMRDLGERAILVQTRQTYRELQEALPHASSLGDGTEATFGETFILDGVVGLKHISATVQAVAESFSGFWSLVTQARVIYCNSSVVLTRSGHLATYLESSFR